MANNYSPGPSSVPLSSNRLKQKIEPTRTSKKTQKLVVFPDADLEATPETIFNEGDLGDVRFPASDGFADKKLRRVTAYLTSESLRITDVLSNANKLRTFTCNEAKRFDEVVYLPICLDQSPHPQDFEEAVASERPFGEVFVFDYGAMVIWGLTEIEEKTVLKELSLFECEKLEDDDVEVENFTFCHNLDKPPRLFNDIINLRSGHHMVKLTISHALAQSVKLAYFEELIDNSILSTKNIPFELSSTGTIRMSRKKINMQIGELFAMRMNVNLISNVLDTPELFWSYPSLGPLYRAVRGYLEISQRAEVLNQRCAVLSDMLDMLRDHANIMHGETLEWIIILLIALEIFIGIAKTIIDLRH